MVAFAFLLGFSGRRRTCDRRMVMRDALSGVIKMKSETRGFAFIHADDGLDYFFHRDQCDESWDALMKGDAVMFERGANDRGPMAMRVTAYPLP